MIVQETKISQIASWAIFFFLSFYVAVNPFSHMTTVKEVCFYGSVLAFVVLLVSGQRDFLHVKTPLRIPTILFVSWIIVGMLWALDKQNSWHDIYAHLFRYIFLYIFVTSFFNSRKNIIILSNIFILSIVSFVSYSLVNFYFVENNDTYVRFLGNSHGMTYNLIGVPIIFSIFLIMSNMLTTSIKKCHFWGPLLIVPLVAALVLTQARGAFLALVVSSLFFVIFYQRKWIPLFVVLFACIVILFAPLKNRFNSASMKNLRIAHGLLVLEVVKDYPITGIGFGMETFGKALDLSSYKTRTKENYNIKYESPVVLNDPHNMYTDILVRTGLPGFVVFVIFVFTLFKMLWQVIKSNDVFLKTWGVGIASSLVGYFVIGFFEPVFSHMHEFNFTLMVSFASILWRQSQNVLSVNTQEA